MIGVRRDYAPSDAEEERRRLGDQWRPPQFSRRDEMGTGILGEAGRRGVGCRHTVRNE